MNRYIRLNEIAADLGEVDDQDVQSLTVHISDDALMDLGHSYGLTNSSAVCVYVIQYANRLYDLFLNGYDIEINHPNESISVVYPSAFFDPDIEQCMRKYKEPDDVRAFRDLLMQQREQLFFDCMRHLDIFRSDDYDSYTLKVYNEERKDCLFLSVQHLIQYGISNRET